MDKSIPITYLYLDTEFTGLQQSASLLSLACVTNNNGHFYAEFTDYPKESISDWIREQVLSNFILSEDLPPKLKGKNWRIRANTKKIKSALLKFISQFESIVIWADHASYDWVLFCQLFGGALHLPKNIHYMPLDLPTALFMNGINQDIRREKFVGKKVINKFPKQAKQRHNALYDAYLLRASVQKLFNN